MLPDAYKVRQLGSYVQIAMLAQERQPGDGAIIEINGFHLSQFDYVPEPHIFQQELKRRVLQSSGSAQRYDNGPYFMAELEKSLEKNVILVIVGNQNEIDFFRQVFIGIPRNLRFIGVTQNRIE